MGVLRMSVSGPEEAGMGMRVDWPRKFPVSYRALSGGGRNPCCSSSQRIWPSWTVGSWRAWLQSGLMWCACVDAMVDALLKHDHQRVVHACTKRCSFAASRKICNMACN